MTPFLSEITDKIIKEHPDFSNAIWVFPSKRAGVFASNYLKKQNTTPIFAPEFLSVEAFIQKLSGIEVATTEMSLCVLYESYLETNIKDKESFTSFTGWGTIVLQDFNEIDRYGVNAKKLYSHIEDYQGVSHWALAEEKTEMVKAYLKFWEILPELYDRFTHKMLSLGLGHQGLLYKKANENIGAFLEAHPKKKCFFIGFNALNTSEKQIIQYILSENRGDIFWDTDPYFLNNPLHEAGYFIRSHYKNWNYFKKNKLKGLSNHYENDPKEVCIYGVPKGVSQAQLIGDLLKEIGEKEALKTAVVLGDENLLNPVIHAIPSHLKANITMGAPLANTPMASLIRAIFDLQNSPYDKGWYFKHVQNILQHPYVKEVLDTDHFEGVTRLINQCQKQNISHLDCEFILNEFSKSKELIQALFDPNTNSPLQFLERIQALLSILSKYSIAVHNSAINSETWYFKDVFEGLEKQIKAYSFIDSLLGLKKIYLESLSKKRRSYTGDALEGLQLMGMLESRNLDFETVIISHVNEGLLPGGKSNNSYIPLSQKKYFGLPSFKEKDAVYAYHFYRLLQRAKKVYLLYNTATDALEGGEPSRFVHQLKTQDLPNIKVVEQLAIPQLEPSAKALMEIPKDQSVLEMLSQKAESGYSPSALNTYIRNPIDFYKRYVLKLKEPEVLEEIIASNTFGTIVHDSLQALYTPFIGQLLRTEHFKEIEAQLPNILTQFFEKHHSPTAALKGKNLIAFSVLLQYLKDFIAYDASCAQKEDIFIECLEKEYKMSLKVPGLSHEVLFKGSLDRIDNRNGVTHIIDFKTGMVKPSHLKLNDWATLVQDDKKSKIFQLLSYALLYRNTHGNVPLKIGIYSFKNTKDGYMFFEDPQQPSQKNIVQTENCERFKETLLYLLSEIFNLDSPFVEREI